jgi:hypothetical protein
VRQQININAQELKMAATSFLPSNFSTRMLPVAYTNQKHKPYQKTEKERNWECLFFSLAR